MKLACQENLVQGKSFADKVAKLESWGFDGVEVWGDFLWERVDEIQAALKGRKIAVGSICNGVRGSLLAAEPEQRQLAVDDIIRLVRVGGDLGAVGLIVVPVFGSPKITDLGPWKSAPELERELLIRLMHECAPAAEEAGCAVLLEPLNRYETHFMNRLEQAVEICRAVDSPAVRLMADFFHMSIEEARIPAALNEAGEMNLHVHLADSNRLLPGMGHTDFAAGFRALKAAGFDKYMALECGVPGDPDQALPGAVEHLRGILAQL